MSPVKTSSPRLGWKCEFKIFSYQLVLTKPKPPNATYQKMKAYMHPLLYAGCNPTFGGIVPPSLAREWGRGGRPDGNLGDLIMERSCPTGAERDSLWWGMDGFCQRGCCHIRPVLWAQVKQDSPPPPSCGSPLLKTSLAAVSRLGWYGAPEPPKHMNPPVAVQPGNYRHVLQQ